MQELIEGIINPILKHRLRNTTETYKMVTFLPYINKVTDSICSLRTQSENILKPTSKIVQYIVVQYMYNCAVYIGGTGRFTKTLVLMNVNVV